MNKHFRYSTKFREEEDVKMPTSILLAASWANVFDLPNDETANVELKTRPLAWMKKSFPFDTGSFRNFKSKILPKWKAPKMLIARSCASIRLLALDCDDDFRSLCRNVSHSKQSFSRTTLTRTIILCQRMKLRSVVS